jgi:hypothetical protein
VPLVYQAPPTGGPVRQGEFLSNLWVHRPRAVSLEQPKGTALPITSQRHALAVALNADCDLWWDFKARFVEGTEPSEIDESAPPLVPYVFLCDAIT